MADTGEVETGGGPLAFITGELIRSVDRKTRLNPERRGKGRGRGCG